MTESAEKKAHRLLGEGRLTVTKVLKHSGLIVASCRGFSDGEIYHLGYDPNRREWRCTCQASKQFGRRCSHLMALQLVTVKPDPAPASEAAA
jgi:hypothetical protein